MNTLAARIDEYVDHAETGGILEYRGHVSRVVGLVIESIGPRTSVGSTCWVSPVDNTDDVLCEVIGFRDDRLLLMPIGDLHGIGPGSEVTPTDKPITVGTGDALLGRIVNGLGEPIDGKPAPDLPEQRVLNADPPDPLRRQRITEPMPIGIRSIDSFLTIGKGQRIGVFAGAGVGKSMLLGQIARCSTADVNVIALIGERGREAREFIEECLGPEGLRKTVVVLVTSDEHCLLRLKGAFTAMCIAEYFRDQGKDVLLTIDSVSRVARAQRELGLSAGEPPTVRGYTPSVFELLPKLMERSAMSQDGSITGVFAVLVEGDDLDEPVSDIMRATVDGHIVLSRKLAMKHHYPAIDILGSLSRSMPDIVDAEHHAAAGRLRSVYAAYENARDMIDLGAYVKGSNTETDVAIKTVPKLEQFLRQLPDENTDLEQTRQTLIQLAADAVAHPSAAGPPTEDTK